MKNDILERHRHHSVHEVYLEQGTGQGTAGSRQGEESGDERDDDQGANNPLAKQDDERDDEQDATATQDEERGDDERDDTTTQDDERDDDQDAIDPRRDIQARLRRASNVIIGDTYANRPQRARPAIDRYQAGAKNAIKRLGRGQGRGRRGGGV